MCLLGSGWFPIILHIYSLCVCSYTFACVIVYFTCIILCLKGFSFCIFFWDVEQNQKLRKMVMEEQSRQQSILLQGYESRISGLLRQRDADLAIARNKTRELQDLLIGAEVEAKLWEKKAMENEAIVSELSNRLSQVRERDAALFSNSSAQDAESFCGSTSAERVNKKEQQYLAACKMCQSRSLSVVFLPCRHLCCCKSCDAFLELCPVCSSLKEDSIEVILG